MSKNNKTNSNPEESLSDILKSSGCRTIGIIPIHKTGQIKLNLNDGWTSLYTYNDRYKPIYGVKENEFIVKYSWFTVIGTKEQLEKTINYCTENHKDMEMK